VGVSPQEGAQEDLDKSVKEELGEDSLDRESKLLEGLQSKGYQYIRFVRGVSSDTLEIALRCRGDVIFVEVKGYRWKECPHVGRGCYYCGDTSHRKKDCPRRTTEGAHGQRIEVQSQQ